LANEHFFENKYFYTTHKLPFIAEQKHKAKLYTCGYISVQIILTTFARRRRTNEN